MRVEHRLRALFTEVVNEARRNPDFAARLEASLGAAPGPATRTPSPRRRNRRAPGPFDPFVVYANGEAALRTRLETLNVEELKDIVAEHGMDAAKLAMKWKTADRLIDLIVTSVSSRSRKGEAFRGDSRG